MQTLSEAMKKHGIRVVCAWIAGRSDGLMAGMPAGSSHWRVTVIMDDRQYSTQYSMGPAHKGDPVPVGVLSSLISDAAVLDLCDNAAAVMAEYGCESKRQAEKIYTACARTKAAMNRVLGEDVLNELMYETEGE